MKWLITGGDGQLGRAMQAHLSKSEVEHIAFNRKELNITDESAIIRVFKETQPDVVLTAAAWTTVDDAEGAVQEALQINAYGPSFLASACAISNARLVQISTDFVFSGNSTTPWLEESKLDPISAYGRTKAQGEELVQATHSSGSYIVRTAWLYSPWGQNFVKTMARIALTEVRTVEVVRDQLGQPTSAMDLATQIHRMVDMEVRPGIYHGTNGGQGSWFDFAREIFFLLNADVDRVTPINSSKLARPAKRPSYSVLGQNRWSMVGMQPMRDWREALKLALPSIISTLSMEE